MGIQHSRRIGQLPVLAGRARWCVRATCEVMMILLVTASKRGVECAAVLEHDLAEPVRLADNLRRATSILRNEEYSAVVLDDAMVDADPDAADILLSTSGTAVPVYVNLALSNSARVAR